MSERKRVGVHGMVVAANIQRLREEKNLTKPELARRINDLHQPEEVGGWELSPSKINALAVTRIENGERRVDADDLVLFAQALGVSPVALLMPYTDNAVNVPSPIGKTASPQYWQWLTSRRPLIVGNTPGEATPDEVRQARQFFNDSLPPWSRDIDRVPAADGRSITLGE